MNYKITGGQVMTYENGVLAIEKRDIYVVGDTIRFTADETKDNFEVIDAGSCLVMPGLINMHTHAYMTIMRNYADDVDFDEWLFKRVMPVEDTLPKEGAYWTNLLAMMEMLRTGTTCFVDMHMFHEQSCRAASEAGVRGYIGRGLVGEDLYSDGWSRFSQAIEEKEKYEGDLLKFILSPHAIYSCGTKLLTQVVEESEKRGMLRQTHLSEGMNEVDNCRKQHGKTPVAYLNDLGFLSDHTILAHCVQMQDDDIDIIARSGSTVVTNPASNAKLGNGFAPVCDFANAGINVAIGTDGTCSNNTLNMFREMGLVSLIHKGVQRSSTAAPADEVVRMATVNAARALRRSGELGEISDGAKADLVFVDLTEPSMFPANNIMSSLCYSANGSEVKSVMIGGKFVMRNREFATIDAERVRYEVQKMVDAYL